jgi:hypothetical protein
MAFKAATCFLLATTKAMVYASRAEADNASNQELRGQILSVNLWDAAVGVTKFRASTWSGNSPWQLPLVLALLDFPRAAVSGLGQTFQLLQSLPPMVQNSFLQTLTQFAK